MVTSSSLIALASTLGVQLTEVSNRFVSSNVQLDNWGGFTQPGELTDILTRSSIAGQFDQVDGGDDPRLHTEYFTTSLEEIIGVGEASYTARGAEYAAVGDCGTGYCASTDWTVDKRKPLKKLLRPMSNSTVLWNTTVCRLICRWVFATKRLMLPLRLLLLPTTKFTGSAAMSSPWLQQRTKMAIQSKR